MKDTHNNSCHWRHLTDMLRERLLRNASAKKSSIPSTETYYVDAAGNLKHRDKKNHTRIVYGFGSIYSHVTTEEQLSIGNTDVLRPIGYLVKSV